mgnify:FL=1
MPFWKRNTGPKTVEVYKDNGGSWRWRSVAKNGKIVDASEQGYSTKRYALRKANSYVAGRDIEVVVVPSE